MIRGILAKGGSIVRAALKFLKVVLLIFLFFLLQTVIMPHLKVAGIMPNLLMVIIAIMTVSYGKLYAFISGALVGIILEAMSYSIPLFYLIIYPVLALLCAQMFADMSDIKREMRRIRQAQRISEAASEIKAPFIRKKFHLRVRRDSPHDLNAHLRILLNTLMLVLMYEGIMLIYIALSGISLTVNHFLRIIYTAAYTAVCCLVMFPVRAWLGLYKRPRRMRTDGEVPEVSTTSEMIRQLAIVPDEAPEPNRGHFLRLRKQTRQVDQPEDASNEIRGNVQQPESEVPDK
jgi:hypothetical protein